jgi:hypothetical protein
MTTTDRWIIVALIVATLTLSFLLLLPLRWSEVLLSNDEMWHASLALSPVGRVPPSGRYLWSLPGYPLS